MKNGKTKHIWRIKPYRPTLKCDYPGCPKIYEDSNVLETHRRVVHCKYKCPKCPKSFKSTIGLAKHKDIHEEPTQPCKTCGKKFHSYVSSFNCKNSHTKPYKCKFCNRGFGQKHILTRHELVHIGEKNSSESK